MLFLMGPRQVGKTTLCLLLPETIQSDCLYLNWDNLDHREIILEGPSAIAKKLELHKVRETPPLFILDEIHKYSDWKIFIKGFFDTYSHAGEVKIVVTGSARLDIYKAGGDSLMGRYFRYRIHPFTCAEILGYNHGNALIQPPQKIKDEDFQALLRFGGFPEPLFKRDNAFYQNWSALRWQQLFNEDVRDLTRVQEVKQMELLAAILSKQIGALVNYSSLAKKVRVSHETVRRWMETLNQLYYCFTIQPWTKNITRSLLKEPKVFLWDWSLVHDEGARGENFIASHLIKACHYWTDTGKGEFELFFLRDKQKREVDFLIAKNGNPWFLVEVKKNSGSLSPNLEYFHKLAKTKHAFQVVIHGEYQEANCFRYTQPVEVSAKTFLSQLL